MRFILFFFLLLFRFFVFGQSRSTKDWINYGSSHISKWIQVAPGKLGPSALPVPEMDYARVDSFSKVETGIHAHFMDGDTAVNSYLAFQWTVVPRKIAIKFWGFPAETFRTNNAVRDERQIYYDDTGWMTKPGDLWASTFVQVVRDRKNWPDLLLNYSFKSTTGSVLQGRYTDGHAYYIYLAFGKSIYTKNNFINEIRLAGMVGFYEWQTNKVEMAQDEGPVFEAGIKLRYKNLWIINEFGGYHGFDAYSFIGARGYNDPLVYRLKLMRQGKNFDWNIEYKTGWQDYNYSTFKIEVGYRFKIR